MAVHAGQPTVGPGTVVADRYRVVRLIGHGATGEVYELMHERLDRSFALKTLSPQLAHDEVLLARFRREADVIASLRHPNIVDIVDWDTLEDGTPCMVMEYLDGQTLAQRLADRGALSWAEIARIGDQVLAALTVAHGAGVVHRDLKPDNIFLARIHGGETVKLLDFGVSKIRNVATVVTAEQALVGTPAYMSPEQAHSSSQEIDHTTDLWSMGAMLFEMATGARAFQAETVPALLYHICHEPPEPLAAYRSDAPPGFAAVLERALSRDRAARFASADHMRSALHQALAPALAAPGARADTHPPAAHAAPHPVTTLAGASGQALAAQPRPARRRTGLWVVAGLVAGSALAVALTVAAGDSDHGDPPPAQEPTATAQTPAEPAAAPPAVLDADAGMDAGMDAGADAGADAGVDAGADAGAPVATPEPRRPQTRTKTRAKTRRAKKRRHRRRPPREPARKRGDPVDPFRTR